MASLLVYVAEKQLGDVFGVRTAGRRVPVLRAKLPPQIERLDARSTLFFVTVVRVRARIIACIENPLPDGPVIGEATIHDHDITDLLVRLGCPKVWHVSTWASTPRIVPPNDVQLLRYSLGLPLETDELDELEPNAPIPVVYGKPLHEAKKPAATAPDPKLVEVETKLAELEGWLAKFRSDTGAATTLPPPSTLATGTLSGARREPGPQTVKVDDSPWSSEDTQTGRPPPPPKNVAPPHHSPPVSPMVAPHRPNLSHAPTRRVTTPPSFATVGDALRAAVFASPASDAARREYAENLISLGDERGELIALQLARVERGEPVGDRERVLVGTIGEKCAQPLAPYFASFELHRGFVWKARMPRGLTVPDHVRDDPAWSTIGDLATTDTNVLATASLTSIKVARIDQRTFEQLGTTDGLVRLDTLLPYPDATTRGIVLEPIDIVRWLDVIDGGAFVTHSLCVDAERLAGRMPQFMHSRLVRRLSHLDAWIDAASAPDWRTAFDASELPLMTLRFAANGIEPVVAFERRDGAPRMVVELRATVSAEIATQLAVRIAKLGHGVDTLELVDTSLAPFAAQQPELTRALAPAFKTIELRRAESLALV